MKTILITGASSGIGMAAARSLDNNTNQLILCGRNIDALSNLQNELKTTSHVLSFDVRDYKAVEKAMKSLPPNFQDPDVLINNAGGAHGVEEVLDGDIADWNNMIDSNVKGLLYMVKTVVPRMKDKGSGMVINVSSIAGKESYAGGVVYCAAKAAVESISKGLRLELVPHGIRVCNIAPGAVETNFSLTRYKGDQAKADAVYNGFQPLIADDIAQAIKFCINQPDHVQLADMLIFPSSQASAKQITRS